MADWEVGDLAQCVRDCSRNNCGVASPIRLGAIYTVSGLVAGRGGSKGKMGLTLYEVAPPPPMEGFWQELFRKIDRCEDEFTELMRQMKPMPEKVS